MKRIEYFDKNDPELMRVMEYLIDCCIKFEVRYSLNFVPVIEFECSDLLYNSLMKYAYRA